jgi:hypothetical protein
MRSRACRLDPGEHGPEGEWRLESVHRWDVPAGVPGVTVVFAYWRQRVAGADPALVARLFREKYGVVGADSCPELQRSWIGMDSYECSDSIATGTGTKFVGPHTRAEMDFEVVQQGRMLTVDFGAEQHKGEAWSDLTLMIHDFTEVATRCRDRPQRIRSGL